MKIVALFLLLSASTFVLEAQNQTKTDSKINKKVLWGRITLEAFSIDLCQDWYAPEYVAFVPKAKIIKKLEKLDLSNISIELILGSWCHDSHREVPRFIKILNAINFQFDQLQMNALDTFKTSPDYDTKGHKIVSVPTVIVYRNEKEIGRIIESPKKSLEKDLLKIISKN